MVDLTHPPEKDPASLEKQHIVPDPPSPTEDATPPPSTRQNVFLLSLLWLTWIISTTFDTIVEAENRARFRRRLSPLQSHVYETGWDLGLYKVSASIHTASSRKKSNGGKII
jgi:hypothetical protein